MMIMTMESPLYMLGIIKKVEMNADDDGDGYDDEIDNDGYDHEDNDNGITAVSRRLRWTKAGQEGFPVLGLLGAEV